MATKKKAKALPTTITLRPNKIEAKAIIDLAERLRMKWNSQAIMYAVTSYPGDQILKDKYRQEIRNLSEKVLFYREELETISALIAQFKRMSTELSKRYPE